MSDDINVLDTREIDGIEHRVYLEWDHDCESPRELGDAHAGMIVIRSQPRYIMPAEDGDKINASEIQYAIDSFSFQAVARWLRIFHGATVVLPLYSGTDEQPSAGDEVDVLKCGDYIGVTFDQPSTRKITGIEPDDMAWQLTADVDEYAAWGRGDCYGYIIERAEDQDSDPLLLDISDHEGWEEVSSCWGLIGETYAEQAAKEALSDL